MDSLVYPAKLKIVHGEIDVSVFIDEPKGQRMRMAPRMRRNLNMTWVQDNWDAR